MPPEDVQGTASNDAPSPVPFHVELSDPTPLDVESIMDPTKDDVAAADTTSQDDSTQDASAQGATVEEKPELPTPEEVGVDKDSPEYKAIHRQFLRAWNRWTSKKDREAKAATTQTEDKPADAPADADAANTQHQQPTYTGDDDVAAVYAVDYSDFNPKITLRENSDLAMYEEELTDYIKQVALQATQHTLNGVQKNDAVYRQTMAQRQQQQHARELLVPKLQALSEHPDFDDNAKAELQAFAAQTQQLLLNDPLKWLKSYEAVSGMRSDWREDAEADADKDQRATQSLRLANKARSITPRPTRAPARQPDPAGTMSLEDATTMALKKYGVV